MRQKASTELGEKLRFGARPHSRFSEKLKHDVPRSQPSSDVPGRTLVKSA